MTMDIRLHYQEMGSGPVMLLLHGNGENSDYFVHQMRAFSERYRVLALDTRGHGQSPRGDAPFTIAQFAEDLHDWMDEMGIEQAVLLGFSDGANTALCFALQYPDRVERLILNGGNLNAAGVKPRVQLPIEWGYRCAALFAGRSAAARRKQEFLGLMVKGYDLSFEDLKAIRMPVLVIAGTRDMIRTAHTRAIAAAIPGARLVFLPGGHFVANRCPSAFNRAVLDFCGANECETN